MCFRLCPPSIGVKTDLDLAGQGTLSSKMNIFFLDFNPRRAAEYHCDKHVVKMILETAQLLYCVHWVLHPESIPAGAYRKTHPNHPCAIWARESLDNYTWLCELGLELCREYTFRYDKIHKTESHLFWLMKNPPALSRMGITQIRLAMPDEYKLPNPVEAYRKYYIENKFKKRDIVKYSRRQWPSFIPNAMYA